MRQFCAGYIGRAEQKGFWRSDISEGQDKKVFGDPIYREARTKRFLAIRYIGKPGQKGFWRSDISGSQDKKVFGNPIHRKAGTKRFLAIRYIGKPGQKGFWQSDISGSQDKKVFGNPIYRGGKTNAILPIRYIGDPCLPAGLYDLLSYTIAQRTGEIGIRMALGAKKRVVVWMILRDTIGCYEPGRSLLCRAVLSPRFSVSGLPTSRQLTGNIWHRVFRCGISRTCESLDVNYLPVLASGFENRDWSICLFCST
jgi:hypothetical protein